MAKTFSKDTKWQESSRNGDRLNGAKTFYEKDGDLKALKDKKIVILGYGSQESDDQFSPRELAIIRFVRIHVADPLVKSWIEGRKYKLRYLPSDGSLNQMPVKKLSEKKL